MSAVRWHHAGSLPCSQVPPVEMRQQYHLVLALPAGMGEDTYFWGPELG